jgi:hypothetical protein
MNTYTGTSWNRFTADNTKGYSAKALAALNARFDQMSMDECAIYAEQLDAIAERVLVDFNNNAA